MCEPDATVKKKRKATSKVYLTVKEALNLTSEVL